MDKIAPASPSGMNQNSSGTEAVLKSVWMAGTSVTRMAITKEINIASGSQGLRRFFQIGSACRRDMRLLRTDIMFPRCRITRVTK